MICYRDMTFCSSIPCTCPPRRRLTQEVWEAAATAGLPVSYADLCGSKSRPVQRREALQRKGKEAIE